MTNKLTVLLLIAQFFLGLVESAAGDMFGSGANTFDIEFVPIGNPGNAADPTNSAGSVAYSYRMGKFEIPEQMIDKANTLGGLGITKDTRGPDKPATSVSWSEAARFVNWLNTSTGSPPAYKFTIQPGEPGYGPRENISRWSPGDTGYDPNNLYRNSLARYFLPSADEWYKAASYDPTSGVYYDYPTGSDTAPTAVASGTAADTAVYNQLFEQGPADITLAGGLSPYGTMGQGGNVSEFEETVLQLEFYLDSGRLARGGDWIRDSAVYLLSRDRTDIGPGGYTFSYADKYNIIGFRVASIAELPGDFNHDGTVDAADYVVWRKTDGTLAGYNTWRTHFGQTAGSGSAAGANAAVPEPATLVLLMFAMAGWCLRRGQSA